MYDDNLNHALDLVDEQAAAAEQSLFSHAIVIKPIIFLLLTEPTLKKQNCMRKKISMKRAQSPGDSGLAKVMTIGALMLMAATDAR